MVRDPDIRLRRIRTEDQERAWRAVVTKAVSGVPTMDSKTQVEVREERSAPRAISNQCRSAELEESARPHCAGEAEVAVR